MIIAETIFVDRLPIGRILMSSDSQDLAFHFEPAEPPSKLHKRIWQSIDELRIQIAAAYKNSGKDQVSVRVGT